MPLLSFDHVNIRTAQLEQMIAFYVSVLGLRTGPRPDFPFGGAWLYLGDRAHVHLIEVDQTHDPVEVPKLEHFAFLAEGLSSFLQDLDTKGISYRLSDSPELPVVQVNIHDPDGNHIHVDFDKAERT